MAGAEWFGEEVRRQMVDRFGADATDEGGLVVRTSLDPALQATADQVLRRGLINYDRVHGGWRGPVARLDPSAATLRAGWPRSLAALAAAARHAAHLDARRGAGGQWRRCAAWRGWMPQVRSIRLAMLLSDTAWARPNHNGSIGGSPRKMADVVQVGDVVMVEPAATALPPGHGRGG